ncbi:hypothetical protein GCM10009754_47100 [Amycolatopsis minnesotensis]|uniref:Uncharacterized protein n=1 Tax=Amycolatopsis minnesotensis TaxID=337894 RepID=A0ABN2RG91_9PSEU
MSPLSRRSSWRSSASEPEAEGGRVIRFPRKCSSRIDRRAPILAGRVWILVVAEVEVLGEFGQLADFSWASTPAATITRSGPGDPLRSVTTFGYGQ